MGRFFKETYRNKTCKIYQIMYHNSIKINIDSYYKGVMSNYKLIITTLPMSNDKGVKYSELLSKFNSIGFNINYLRFPEFDVENEVYCTYNNIQSNKVFFKSWERTSDKILEGLRVLSFHYGNLIDGKFYSSNMNFYSDVFFYRENNGFLCNVIKGIDLYKGLEIYSLVDDNGKLIYMTESAHYQNFEHDFFENKKVQYYLRKYKLEKLKKAK